MGDQPSWRPSDEEIATAINEYMKRLARKYMGGALPGGVVGDLQDNPVVDLIDRAVEKALAYHGRECSAAGVALVEEARARHALEMEKALAEQAVRMLQTTEEIEARHRREVLNAQVSSLVRIEALLASRRGTALQVVRDAIDIGRAELAALDKGDDNG